MTKIQITPIAIIRNLSGPDKDSLWGNVESEIILNSEFDVTAFEGIEKFSHLEIIFLFDRVNEDKIHKGSRHPRDNKDLPVTGIFAQRGKDRPNRLGATIVDLISRSGNKLTVKNLDALDGSPVIDIKPVMKKFLPSTEIKEPAWTDIVMKNYWE